MRRRTGLLAAGVTTLAMVAPAGGGERRETGSLAIPNVTVKTFDLPSEFKAPWQLLWIADGTKDGAIAFTDRTGNQVGLLDPTTGNTQAIPLRVITNPNPIAAIDQNRFAIAGTGGVGILDRSGTGRITELQMDGTRNTVLAVGPDNRLFVADAQNNDLRIIGPPYAGPANITKLPLPSSCRSPTGMIPRTATISVLCQQTNNIVDLSPTGALLRSTPLPFSNMGAQEARPTPAGFVFSGFNANRVAATRSDYPDPYNFVDVLLNGAAVSTVGYFHDPASASKLAAASVALANKRRPKRDFFFNTYTPSFRDGRSVFGSFPAGTARRFSNLANRNLVGSANGPGGSILVADSTPGRQAIHSLVVQGQNATGRPQDRAFPRRRVTQANQDFLTRMSMPFFGPVPPREVRATFTGASSSAWSLKSTFGGNFNLEVNAHGTLQNGRRYGVKFQSGDTGAFTRAYRFSGFRRRTKSLNLTLTGSNRLPASFTVDAVAVAPEACECQKLNAFVSAVPRVEARSDGLRLAFRVTSLLDCSGGPKNSKCDGRLELSPTTGDRADGLHIVGDSTVSCDAPCGGGSAQNHRLALEGGASFGTRALGKTVRVISLEIDRICGGKRSPRVVDFVFDRDGKFSYKLSDLNGNGIPDAKDKA